MPDYSKIQNEKLRSLVVLSESIHSQPESEIQAMVDRIASLPLEGQDAMIAALEEEQKQIQMTKQAKGITPEMEMQHIEGKNLKLSSIKHEFDKAVLETKEQTDQDTASAEADSLISNL